jgi:SAM-dependent methyltransferase
MQKNSQYKYIASIYPHIMKHVNYDKWYDYISLIIEPYLTEDKPAILELAAGNLTLANLLSKRWNNVIATDYSKEMLLLDSRKKLPKVCCDMTNLCFSSQFDIIISSFDSVNYLLSKKKLSLLFNEVKHILKPDGIFLFDASLEANSIIFSKVKERIGVFNKIKYKHVNHYMPEKRLHINEFILYLDGKEYVEIHKQKIFPFEDYFSLLEKAGLYVSECFECFSFNSCHSDSKRAQFIVKKVI